MALGAATSQCETTFALMPKRAVADEPARVPARAIDTGCTNPRTLASTSAATAKQPRPVRIGYPRFLSAIQSCIAYGDVSRRI